MDKKQLEQIVKRFKSLFKNSYISFEHELNYYPDSEKERFIIYIKFDEIDIHDKIMNYFKDYESMYMWLDHFLCCRFVGYIND